MSTIGLFPAPRFDRAPLKDEMALLPGNKPWSYAGSGRACLYHILKSVGLRGQIAVPAYVCQSVLAPINKIGLDPVFFDLDPADLNPSVSSLADVLTRNELSAVLFPSLYGLPADCASAEDLCRGKGVILIDDAAQSFGASLNRRQIGTFGDAGFIAFSPGKATSAHCGGLYWTNWPHAAPSADASFCHRIAWVLFSRARMDRQSAGYEPLQSALAFAFAMLKRRPGWDDGLSEFEADRIGGVLHSVRTGKFAFREAWFQKAVQAARGWHKLRVVDSIRGHAHPHKIVVVADSIATADALKQRLDHARIRYISGYPLLSQRNVPRAVELVGRIIELPIVEHEHKMETLLGLLSDCDCAL